MTRSRDVERLFGKRALLGVLDRPAELTKSDPIAYLPEPDRAGGLTQGRMAHCL
jgi:hypothetical protein